jgi:transcription elongation GreA/GreB family factor
VKKPDLRRAILNQLRRDLAVQVNAAQLARDEATHEESRPENKYDTHSQEAAYLAEGQARLAAKIEASLAHYTAMPLPDFGPADVIALGAIVEVGDDRRRSSYFLGPRAGGMELTIEGESILVLTPQSPLGRQLLGKRIGDAVQLPGRGAATPRIISIK